MGRMADGVYPRRLAGRKHGRLVLVLRPGGATRVPADVDPGEVPALFSRAQRVSLRQRPCDGGSLPPSRLLPGGRGRGARGSAGGPGAGAPGSGPRVSPGRVQCGGEPGTTGGGRGRGTYPLAPRAPLARRHELHAGGGGDPGVAGGSQRHLRPPGAGPGAGSRRRPGRRGEGCLPRGPTHAQHPV